MIALLFALARCSGDDGVGGFIKFGFPYNENKADLLSQLTVVVKTPQGSIVDEAEVQPTGYWIIPTPTHRELVISVHGPEGLQFSPQKQIVNFPFNSDVDFQILGFSISGKVITKTASGESVPVSAQLTIDIDQEQTGAHLTTTSTTEGTFSVGPVVPGTYKVQIKNAIAQPQNVVVKSGSAVCEPLLITDWPQSGRIVFPEGVKARKVNLKLTGAAQQKFETDSDGFFMLKNLNVGRYYLECDEENVAISTVAFSVTSAELPTPLTVNFQGININGKVVLPNKNGVQGVIVKILPEGKTTKTNEKGEFTFAGVKACEKPEIVAELPFTTFKIPELKEITTIPVEPVEIVVVNARITGFVDCPSASLTVSGAVSESFTVTNKTFSISAPVGQKVTIKAESECGFETNELTVVSPAEKVKFQHIKAKVSGSVKGLTECADVKVMLKGRQGQYTFNVDQQGKFSGEEVEFGTYSLSISAQSNTVWKETKTTLIVNQKVIDAGEVAHQTAFRFHVTASHQMNVAFGKQIVSLDRGTNTIETTGTVVSPADCHIFEPFDVRYNTRIVVSSIEREIIVTGETEDSNYEVFVNQKPLSPPYKFTQGLEETVTAQVDASSPFYVEPSRIEVHAPQNCDTCGIKFEVLRGKEYKGKIFPAIEGVLITAKSDGKVITSGLTSSTGEYTLGSHPSNIPITVTAQKIGYSIRQRENSLDFEAEKLASFTINFDKESADGTLVSLTRADGFRKTERVDSQVAVFSELPSGEYTINPVKREYLFTPKMKTLKLAAGEDAKFNFSVTRTRFGISGKVTRITGEPEPDVEVTAIHPDGEKTSDVTSAEGTFRLGNLLPNATYTIIAAATGTSNVKRITPEGLKVKLGEQDSTGLSFLSIKPSKSFDILGEVEIEQNLLPNLNVILTTESGKVAGRYEFQSKSSNFFFFTNLTEERYKLNVASRKQLSDDLNCETIEVDQSAANANVVIKCNVHHNTVQQTGGSKIRASIFAFGAIFVWIVFFNFAAFKEAFKPAPQKKKRA
jgi:hypothetical protein